MTDEGASPLFPPKHPDEASARHALLLVIRRDPRTEGYDRTRWRLQDILDHCEWLKLETCAGLHRLFNRLGISYKQGRHYIHSPDPHYEAKQARIERHVQQVHQEPDRFVLLYQDELTYYQVPSLAKAYEASGPRQPRARLPFNYGEQSRVVATLNALTGQVHAQQRDKIGVQALGEFYTEVCADYPEAEVIYLVQDNAPVHFHPNLLARLQPQDFQWPLSLPPNWPTEPDARAIHDDLPIQLLRLPTYASWLNPIEKLWRWLKQDVLHMHRLADDWHGLRQLVNQFLERFLGHSPQLLRYVGLLPN